MRGFERNLATGRGGDSFILYYLPVLGYSNLICRTPRRPPHADRVSHEAQDQRQTRPQAQHRSGARGVLRAHLQARLGAALEGDELGRHQGAGHARRAACLALRRREGAGDGVRRPDQRRGGQAPRADPREPRDARRVEGDQHAVRRHPDDPAGRGRAGAPPRLVGDPLRARRRGRLHRGRGREGVHVARRLRHHRQLGAARSRQPVEEADALARRARFPGGQFLRGVVRGHLYDEDNKMQKTHARRRRLRGVLCVRRAAGRRADRRSTAAR